MPRPGCFMPGKDLEPTEKEVGWARRPVWIVENLVPTGVRTTDHPAHSVSLYQLHYPSL